MPHATVMAAAEHNRCGIRLTPVEAARHILENSDNVLGNHGRSETLRVNIFRRNDRGDLDLIETSSSDHRLFGVATP
jgi:hypothetical protein